MKKILIIMLALLIATFFMTCGPKVATLTVNVDPADSGTVSVTVDDTTLDSADTYDIEVGKEVTLEATPTGSYNFVEWEDGSTDNPRTLTLEENTTVTATFALDQFELTVSIVGSGSVTANGDPITDGTPMSFTDGTDVELVATAGTDFEFGSWSGDASGTTATVTVTMDADKNVTATFLELFDLTVNTAGTGSGSVTLDPTGGTYADGTDVTITAVPDASNAFDGWSGDVTSTDNPEIITMDADKTVTATFSPITPITPPEGFEGDGTWGGLTSSNTWYLGGDQDPVLSTDYAHGGTYSAKLGTLASGSYEGSSLTAYVNVPTGTPQDIEFFWYKDIEYDYYDFTISIDGTVALDLTDTEVPPAWRGVRVPITDGSHEIEIYVENGSSIEDVNLYIDDFDIVDQSALITSTAVGDGGTLDIQTPLGTPIDITIPLSNDGTAAFDADDTTPVTLSDSTGFTIDTTNLTDPMPAGGTGSFTLTHDGAADATGITVDLIAADASIAFTFTLNVTTLIAGWTETFEDTDGTGSGFDNETVWGNLRVYGSSNNEVPPIISTDQAAGGTHSLKFQTDVDGGSTSLDESLKTLDVTVGPGGATVLFKHYLNLYSSAFSEFNFYVNDTAEIEYSGDANNGVWTQETVNLAPDATYELCWAVDASTGGDNTQVAYIDDVILSGDVTVDTISSIITVENYETEISGGTLDLITATNTPIDIPIDVVNSGKLAHDFDDTNPLTVSPATGLTVDTTNFTDPLAGGATSTIIINHDGVSSATGVTVELIDADGFTVVDSFTLNVDVVAPTFYDDFEGTIEPEWNDLINGFTVSYYTTPVVSSDQASAGTESFKFWVDHPGGLNYSYKVLDIDVGSGGATLIFDLWLDVGPSSFSELRLLDNATSSSSEAIEWDNTETEMTWISGSYPLTADTLHEIVFLLYTSTYSGDGTEVAYIDELKVVGDATVLAPQPIMKVYNPVGDPIPDDNAVDNTFGTFIAGSAGKEKLITVENKGKQDLILDADGITVTDGAEDGTYSLTTDPTAGAALTLTPGDSTTVGITFVPGASALTSSTADVTISYGGGTLYEFGLTSETITAIFYENFAATDADSSGTYEWTELDSGYTWNVINNGGDNQWAIVDDDAGDSLNGTQFAWMDGDGGSPNEDSELITPDINTMGYTSLNLMFSHYYDEGFGDSIEIDVWDGTQYVNVYIGPEEDVGSYATPDQFMLDLSAYVDMTDFKIRFHYYDGSYDYHWAIDDVVLY